MDVLSDMIDGRERELLLRITVRERPGCAADFPEPGQEGHLCRWAAETLRAVEQAQSRRGMGPGIEIRDVRPALQRDFGPDAREHQGFLCWAAWTGAGTPSRWRDLGESGRERWMRAAEAVSGP